MSLAQLKTVNRAQKDQGKCARCGDRLPAGSPYRYFRNGFRGPKVKFCMKEQCTPRQSERESSKLSGVYAAVEDARTAINEADTVQLVMDAIEACSAEVQSVIDEYEEAFAEMPALEEQLQEVVEQLSDFVSNLDGFSPEEPDDDVPDEDDEDPPGEDGKDVEGDDAEQLLLDAQSEAMDLLDTLEV